MHAIVAATGNALFYGVLGWVAVGRVGTQEQARLAGVFLILGFVIGSLGGHAGTEPDENLTLRAAGYTIALAIVVVSVLAMRMRAARQLDRSSG